MIVIRLNFLRPKGPRLYKDAKVAVRATGIQHNIWRSGIGNTEYETWTYGPFLLMKEYYDETMPVPLGMED